MSKNTHEEDRRPGSSHILFTCRKTKVIVAYMTLKSCLHPESAFLWWLYSWEDTKQCTQKLLLLSTLEYNEHASASMSTKGKDNAPSYTAKCLCSSKGHHIWPSLHLGAKHCTGACLWPWLPTWHLYSSMADILFGRARERNAECQSGPTVLVWDIRVLCWNN